MSLGGQNQKAKAQNEGTGKDIKDEKNHCTSILDPRRRSSWGSVGLVLTGDRMLWMSSAQHIRVFHVELLQLQLKPVAATKQLTQKKARKSMWIAVLESARCSEKLL